MIYFFCFAVTCLVFAALYIKFGYPEVTRLSYLFKMAASFSFAINGLLGYYLFNSGVYAKWVMWGLIFGLIGDIVIALEPFLRENENKRRNNAIATTAGGALFFVGHILYIVAFVKEIIRLKGFNPVIYFSIVLFFLTAGFVMYALTKTKLGKFTVPIVIYAIAITSMFALSVNIAAVTPSGIIFKIIMIIAPLLFVISDGTIVLKFFNKQKFGTMSLRIINLGTYFISQTLFALSIYLNK